MNSSSHKQHISESPAPNRSKTASRVLDAMLRSLSSNVPPQKKRKSDVSSSGMYSTPEERSQHPSSRFQYSETSAAHPSHPPTTQQIAMGLHLSRTPHLRPVGSPHQRHGSPASPSAHSRAHPLHLRNMSINRDDRHTVRPITPLPPPPVRSSLKKSSASSSSTMTPPTSLGLSTASASTTTVTSTASTTPGSSQSMMSLKLRMPKFTRVSSKSSSSPTTPGNEASTPKKAVRFSTNIHGLDESVSSRA